MYHWQYIKVRRVTFMITVKPALTPSHLSTSATFFGDQFTHCLYNGHLIHYEAFKQRRQRRQSERQKSNRFRSAKQQPSRFLYVTLPSLHDYDVKMSTFTFCGRWEHKTMTHGQNLISRTRGSSGHLEKIPTENNENFTKKGGISKIICDTACRAIYLNTRTRLRLKGWLI